MLIQNGSLYSFQPNPLLQKESVHRILPEKKSLSVEKPLGQSGNKRDLNNQPHQCFKGCQHREGIIK